MDKRAKAKKLYVDDGYGVTDIANLLQVERGTVYYYKNSDKDKGIDWDELRYIKALNPKDTVDKEKRFLTILIGEFDKALVEFSNDNEMDPHKKLMKLEGFARTYYKLKVPDPKTDLKLQKSTVIKEVITSLINIAIEHDHKETANFLSLHSEQIVEDLLKM